MSKRKYRGPSIVRSMAMRKWSRIRHKAIVIATPKGPTIRPASCRTIAAGLTWPDIKRLMRYDRTISHQDAVLIYGFDNIRWTVFVEDITSCRYAEAINRNLIRLRTNEEFRTLPND